MLEVEGMSRDGIMYAPWGEMLPQWACVSVQLGCFASASRVVAVFMADNGYYALVENERGVPGRFDVHYYTSPPGPREWYEWKG
eukprot:8932269-Alexandrium_andersonii.AAC.1